MASLNVRYAHSRFQLRRATGATTVIGAVMLVLAVILVLASVATAASNPSALIWPAVVAVVLGFTGRRVLTGGALLLETEASGTYVASTDQRLTPQQLRQVRVAWRLDFQRETEVQITLMLETGSADVTQGWLTHADPQALATLLEGQLGVPATVEETPTATS